MKRAKFIPILLIGAVLFTGCVSDSEYEALEERVSYLESMLGVTQETEQPSSEESEEDASSAQVEDTATTEAFTYRIDSLSNDQVLAECKYYFDNVPNQGETFDEYYSSLKATPIKTYNDNGVYCRFYDDSDSKAVPGYDVIREISINGTQAEMDGTIGYSGNSYTVHIGMVLTDYDRAEYIYDNLYNMIVTDKFEVVYDRKDSTSWYIYCNYNDGDVRQYEIETLKMNKRDDRYYLDVSYYHPL